MASIVKLHLRIYGFVSKNFQYDETSRNLVQHLHFKDHKIKVRETKILVRLPNLSMVNLGLFPLVC